MFASNNILRSPWIRLARNLPDKCVFIYLIIQHKSVNFFDFNQVEINTKKEGKVERNAKF